MIYLQCLLASMVWGGNIVMVEVMGEYYTSYQLLMIKLIFSYLIISFYLKGKRTECHQEMKLFFVAFLMMVLNYLLTYLGISLTNAKTCAFINCLMPVYSLLLYAKKNMYMYLKIFYIMMGFFITIGFQINQLLQIGNLLLMIAGVCFVIGQHQNNVIEGNLFVKIRSMLKYALFLLGVITPFENQPLHLTHIPLFILFIMISSLGYIYILSTIFHANQKIGITQTNLFTSLNPLFTLIFSFLFLQKGIQLYEVIGLFMILLTSFIKSS